MLRFGEGELAIHILKLRALEICSRFEACAPRSRRALATCSLAYPSLRFSGMVSADMAICVPDIYDEEAAAEGQPAALRRARGMYFTPAPLADWVVGSVDALLPKSNAGLWAIDPACGSGAFLAA